MIPYQIKFLKKSELEGALRHIGADLRSFPFFDNKREIKTLYISGIDVRAANVLKQEMLSRGGDAAVHAHAVDCAVRHSDILIFGTARQIGFLADKIESMTWWGIPEIAACIRTALSGLTCKIGPAKLPSGRTLPLGNRSLIMGIINLTDDSFYQDSRTCSTDKAVEKAHKMAADGADILDLGAESTRPGSVRVAESEEIAKIVPAVSEIRKALPAIPISIDTTRNSVARAALEAGADIINDISGLAYEPEIAASVSDLGGMLVLMHMKGTPETMQSMCAYSNILLEIAESFEHGISQAGLYGLERSRIILDPGIGFAKNYNQNLFILGHIESFRTFGLPLLIGASRKGTIGAATASESPSERLEGTIAVSSLCAWNGVDIIRVHDVLENRKAVMMIEAIKGAEYE